MKLFKGDTIKRVNKLIDNAEKRKQKLAEKVDKLKAEYEAMYQMEQDDFNNAIIEGGEPDKKLAKARKEIGEELQETKSQLSMIDGVIQSELVKQREEVEKERREFVAEKGEEFRELFDEINELKLAYLNKIIEYRNKHVAYGNEYVRTFRDVSERVGLRLSDPRDHHKLNFNQGHQVSGYYSPMLYQDEVREVFINRKLPYLTEKNKDAFKK
ncbi:hypothetical protein [Bacillus sp. RO1]|uniref:hypothetical protein n=1 Tax=Bacillus sp. RO1 TaxID=2722703 RepID=UPI0014564AA7|nr:hypothetical protein [Bacillus sp. RO1]NLP51280.1 hypothetical protein [Bacillus sp. RO1]